MYSELEKNYEAELHQAIEEESRGKYADAAKSYKAAANLLMEYSVGLDEDEKKVLASSVNRLVDAAQKMNALAKEKGRGKSDKSSGEDDETVFVPTAEKPNVHFSDIAGLEEAKRTIMEEIIEPRNYPDVYKRFNQDTNGGILLYGLPGTGKTMTAKAIATEINADFFPIRCSDIVGKWFGEAEKRVRALFKAGRESENAIIFFDEFDALAAKRGGNSTVMNRLVPELLSQMDGFDQSKGKLTIIAATNIPWALDTAFLRRFFHQICVPLPDDKARAYMFNHLLEKMPKDEQLDIDALVKMTEGFTCADIRNIVNSATRHPIRRQIETKVDQYITQQDLLRVMKAAHSSIQAEDIVKLNRWNASRGLSTLVS